MINWLYTAPMLRQAQDLRVNYSDTRLHDRLLMVLRERLGHRVAAEVEQAKIRSSLGNAGTQIDLSFIEPGLLAALDAAGMARDLDALLDRVVQCGQECVRRAGLTPAQLDTVYLTGGSSALRPFQQRLQRAFPHSALVVGDLFGGVAAGLAYAASRGAQTSL